MKRLLLGVMLVSAVALVRADYYEFTAITENDPSGHAQWVGESQLIMEVSELVTGNIRLTFHNEGDQQAALARIYFDIDPALSLELIGITGSDGVTFQSKKTNPGNLPAGRSLDFVFDSDLEVSSANPAPHLGVNPGESLELIMGYTGPDSIFAALGDERLRVGLHVISLGEYSESFVNVIPEPATITMLLSGSLFLRLFRTRRMRRRSSQSPRKFEELDYHNDAEDLSWGEAQRQESRPHLTRYEAAVRVTST